MKVLFLLHKQTLNIGQQKPETRKTFT